MLQGSRFPENNTGSAGEFITHKGNEGGTESQAIDPKWAEADGSMTLLDGEADEDHLAPNHSPPSEGIPHRHVDTFQSPGHVVTAVDQANTPPGGNPGSTSNTAVPAEGNNNLLTRLTKFCGGMDFRP
ncbi:hypothetical protein R3P38DRAFT_3195981 [Favolaschia claudopus]|uniref:Uncharacterized protein n=1 Tax=Favolaschia claudopus TaxID=2862362 RepID=A0AAW0B8X2_9AGAR